MKQRKCVFFLTLILTLTIFSSLICPYAHSKITGQCVNCHTMHNSQGGEDMATFGPTGKPWKTDTAQPALLRGTCLGCHGQGTGNKIEIINGSETPQVYHTDSLDLAGGNFRYIDDNDNRGHNIYMDLGNKEDTLLNAPGHHIIIDSPSLVERFTCAGGSGCHGKRTPGNNVGLAAIKGAHHQNTDGWCGNADTTANSYRFLYGVKGFENMSTHKYENFDTTNHNEYFGATSPTIIDADTECMTCHNYSDSMTITVPGNTISGFCGTCHERFYAQNSIGGTSSPFIKHPTDIVLPSDGEYASYETYSVEAPVGRTTVPISMSSTVLPGTDVVTCLSCHAAHATNYPDLLRWNYDEIISGSGGSDTGCFTCHTKKND
jgi:hypothetical protein